MERKIVFWEARGNEHLEHEDMDEAIETALEDSGEMSGVLTVIGFARAQIPDASDFEAEDLVISEMEKLDEELGDPYDAGSLSNEPTPEMIEAGKTFLNIVRKGYVPWACDRVKEVKIIIEQWIKKNRPEWLEEVADE